MGIVSRGEMVSNAPVDSGPRSGLKNGHLAVFYGLLVGLTVRMSYRAVDLLRSIPTTPAHGAFGAQQR
jgi:hypothetical protein